MPPTITPQEFIDKWRSVELKERSASQEHFIDLCRLVGHKTPSELDPKGDFFTFEKGATKQKGGEGWADVWYQNHFGWEYKGKHKDLDKAYDQLLQYRQALQNPPLLIVSDTDKIIIHTNFTNTIQQDFELELVDLAHPDKLAILRKAFFQPDDLKSSETTDKVTQAAAGHFARLAAILGGYGEDPQQIAHFLIRLLFCLFAEDAGLLPPKLFTRMVQNTRSQPKAFTAQLRQLFQAMSIGSWFGVELIRHFDGRLFDDDRVLELDGECMDVLIQVCGLDWSAIEPSIFGTLFERSLDPGKRAQLGAHYTSREDILLIVEPVLMAPLRRKWEDVKYQAHEQAARAETPNRSERTKAINKLASLLQGFATELSQVQVLDPACGSGNFLYVALRQLLDLWKEVSITSADLGLPRLMPAQAPNPAQLHGIEINEYAHQLAQATIWIGYIQWLRENGFGEPPEPILRPLDNILKMDAILAYDEQGKPIEPEWPKVDVIIGNPPFLGDKKMRGEMGDKYVEDIRETFQGRVPGGADLVTYWFEKARNLIQSGIVKRAGLLATQGIRGGANRTVLDRIKETGDIFWAQSDRAWILDGATVHVSMVGFDDGTEYHRMLDNEYRDNINSDLTGSIDLTKAIALEENYNLAFIGSQKGGKFDITNELAQWMIQNSNNPNRRPNSDVIKPWINGKDITGKPRNMWIIDFGIDTPEEIASMYQEPFEYVKRTVKPQRLKTKSESKSTEYWWLHQRPRPEFREAINLLDKYIVTPRVSKFRIFTWVDREFIPDSAVVAIASASAYIFGVLQSALHEIWARSTGTQLREAESGFRYSQTMTFETFPFPWPPGQEPQDDQRVQAIAQAAKELVELRDTWLNPPGASEAVLKKRTLTNLYNEYPHWLELAHRKLDQAVFAAYGWPDDLSDEEILERLLALNLERAGQ
jgi:type II restriction/modification system DNA methylase subunit YeeA